MCTEEDIAEFYPVREQDKVLIDGALQTFYCLDEPERPLSFSTGIGGNGKARTLYFALYPCNQVNLYWFKDPAGIREDCIADRKLQDEYIGTIAVRILVN